MAPSCNCNTRMIVICSALCSLYLATIFIIVGLTTNYWLEVRDRNINSDDIEAYFGLHRACYTASDRCTNRNTNYDETDSLPPVRGMVCTGAFLAVIATGLAMASFAYDRLGERKLIYTVLSAVFSSFTGLFVMIGIGLFASKVSIDPEVILFQDNVYKGYSFGLTVTAGGMSWISAALFAWACFLQPEEIFEM